MEEEVLLNNKSFARAIGRFFWELVKSFLIALVIIIPIRYYLVQPFFVRGASMEPTFEDGEYLIIDQLSYQWRQPQRGEVIVFRYPLRPSQFFIKRIIGVPGDTVRINEGIVTIKNERHPQGAAIDEAEYLPLDLRTGGNTELSLGESEYFVLGDNRPASSDSRTWGVLKEDEIVGRAWLRVFPFDRRVIFHPASPGFIGLPQVSPSGFLP